MQKDYNINKLNNFIFRQQIYKINIYSLFKYKCYFKNKLNTFNKLQSFNINCMKICFYRWLLIHNTKYFNKKEIKNFKYRYIIFYLALFLPFNGNNLKKQQKKEPSFCSNDFFQI